MLLRSSQTRCGCPWGFLRSLRDFLLLCYSVVSGPGGGIGRHVRLRCVWGNPWEFESPPGHHACPRASGSSGAIEQQISRMETLRSPVPLLHCSLRWPRAVEQWISRTVKSQDCGLLFHCSTDLSLAGESSGAIDQWISRFATLRSTALLICCSPCRSGALV